MKFSNSRWLLTSTMAAALLAMNGCNLFHGTDSDQASASATRTLAETANPNATPTPTATSSASPTPSVTPSVTPSPTVSPAPSPSPSPSTVPSPAITSFSPARAAAGITVTILGSGFLPEGNDVYFGPGGFKGLPSYENGTKIDFVVPDVLSACWNLGPHQPCPATLFPIDAGTYAIHVKNSDGDSVAAEFEVQEPGTPAMTSFSPAAAPVGATVIINGGNFSLTGNTIRFGLLQITDVNANSDGTQLTFTVPDTIQGCSNPMPPHHPIGPVTHAVCIDPTPVVAGPYGVSVINADGTESDSLDFEVTDGASI